MITATTTEGLVVRHIYACIYKIYRTRNQYMFIFFSPNPSFYEQFSPKPLGGTKLCRQPCEAENGAEPQWCSLRCEEDISAGRWQWWGTDTGCWSHSKIEAVHLERRPSMLPWMGSRENLGEEKIFMMDGPVGCWSQSRVRRAMVKGCRCWQWWKIGYA